MSSANNWMDEVGEENLVVILKDDRFKGNKARILKPHICSH